MACCENTVDAGCFNYYSTIPLGFNALETGAHTLEVYLVNGSKKELTETYTATNEMTITAGTLNESKPHDIKIKQPSGNYYEFATDTLCVRVTTQIHK